MNKSFLLIIFLFFFISARAQRINLSEITDSIKIQNVKENLYFLASDSLGGRKTYEKGQKYAAAFIAEKFDSYHLNQLKGSEGYYQKFIRYKLQGSMALLKNTKHSIYSFFFSNRPVKDTSEIEFLFAGRATKKDFQSLDIKNKAIVFLADNLSEGIKKADELSCDFPDEIFCMCLKDKRTTPRFVNFFRQKPLKISEVTGFKDFKEYFSRLYFNELNKEEVENGEYINKRLDSTKNIRLYVIGKEQLEKLFGLKAGKLYKKAHKNIKSKTNLLLNIPEVKVKQFATFIEKIDTLQTENVIAAIEGTDKKDEAIIISAHYDHLGKQSKGIYPGADDNASGTTALIEIAGAYGRAAQNGIRPKRTVIFIAFTGEEKGLVGSWHYVNNPLFPLDKTVCDINMDMIGRNHKDKQKNINKVFLIGRDPGKHERIKIFKQVNKQYNCVNLDTHPPFIHKIMWLFGSDHHAFQMKGVPSNVIFTGDHKDYHTPADTPDKINYEKLTQIAKLLFLSTWELANE